MGGELVPPQTLLLLLREIRENSSLTVPSEVFHAMLDLSGTAQHCRELLAKRTGLLLSLLPSSLAPPAYKGSPDEMLEMPCSIL